MLRKLGFLVVVGLLCLAWGELGAEATESDGKEQTEFNADVRKILGIIIRSLYTNRGVFLRELISNASDALDKIRYKYLTDPRDPKNKDGEAPTMDIRISVDKAGRTITIRDGGVGMNRTELGRYLGTLGSSGTMKFLDSMSASGEGTADMNLIGQFGVGFYSAYLVAENVRVASKADSDDAQYVWESAGEGTYAVYPDPEGNTLGRGTSIRMDIKPDADEFLEVTKVRELVTKYSEFIHFPILFEESSTVRTPVKPATPPAEAKEAKDGDDDDGEEAADEAEAEEKEGEFVDEVRKEWRQVNEQKPIWTRPSAQLTQEDYDKFYEAISRDSEKPLATAHFKAEGEVEFKSILFVPAKAPSNLFDGTVTTLSNIRLYVRRVFITDEFRELLPRYLNFFRGVVDSDDLPLNVSRELLQESRIIKIIKKKLVRKAISLLQDTANADVKAELSAKAAAAGDGDAAAAEVPERKYDKLWEEYGKSLRLGLIEDTQNRARLVQLLRYRTTTHLDRWVSLEEYVERMGEGQKDIYFLVEPGGDPAKMRESPLLQRMVAAGTEVLLMNDAIDEYCVAHVTEFAGKKLVNMAREDAVADPKAKSQRVVRARLARWKDFLDWFRTVVGHPSLTRVTLSEKLHTSPAVLVSPKYGMGPGMAEIMKRSPLSEKQAPESLDPKRILELNYRHPLVASLRERFLAGERDSVALKETAVLLYDTAAIQSLFGLDDVAKFVGRMQRTLSTALGLAHDAPLADEDDSEYPEEEEKKPAEDADDDDADATPVEEPQAKKDDKADEKADKADKADEYSSDL